MEGFCKSDFMGASGDYDSSGVVLFGIPYDGTSSGRPGSRFAPDAIRSASYGLETYSVYQDDDIDDMNFYDAGNLELPCGNTDEAMRLISIAVKALLDDGKKIIALGGEHLVSLAVATELIKKHPELVVLHFDAHADLRDDYLGDSLSHATVIRRICELFPDGEKKIYQFGIRSGIKEEFDFARDNTQMRMYDFRGIKEALKNVGDAPVYITFDLDVFDPSVLPGTGTPEPGGVFFSDFIRLIDELKGTDVVCIDVVELSPHYDSSGVSSVAAAKVVREFLLLMK